MKNLFTLIAPLFLLGAAICLPPSGEGDPPEAALDVIVRRYPIPAALLTGRATEQSHFRIWPSIRLERDWFVLDNEGGFGPMEEVSDLVHIILGDVLDTNPECWIFANGGTLLVAVDADHHALIAEFFTFLDAVWGEPMQLRLTRVPVAAAGGLQAGLIDDALAVQASQNSGATSRTVTLVADEPTYLAPDTYSSITIGSECEVAEGMAVSVPIRGVVPSGDEIRMSAGRVEGGISLSLMHNRRQLTDQSRRDFQVSIRIGMEGEAGVSILQEGMPLDTFRSRTTCLAGTFFLPQGQALVLEQGAGLERGGVSDLLIIQHLGGGAQPMTQAHLSNGWRLGFMPMGGLDAPSIAGHLSLESRRFAEAPPLDSIPESGFMSIQFTEGNFQEMVGDACAREDDSVRIFGGGILLMSPGQADGLAAGLDLIRGLGRAQRTHTLSLRLFAGDTLMEQAVLPVQEGLGMVLGLGEEHFVYPDASVEIAQNATAPNLLPALCLDGLAFSGRVVMGASGVPSIVMDGLACKTETRLAPAGREGLYSELDRPEVTILDLNGAHPMTVGESGGWTLTLGGGPLRLEINLR